VHDYDFGVVRVLYDFFTFVQKKKRRARLALFAFLLPGTASAVHAALPARLVLDDCQKARCVCTSVCMCAARAVQKAHDHHMHHASRATARACNATWAGNSALVNQLNVSVNS
jgi:hypothetical protein